MTDGTITSQYQTDEKYCETPRRRVTSQSCLFDHGGGLFCHPDLAQVYQVTKLNFKNELLSLSLIRRIHDRT